jgi:periplasmic mercuric ion binding protein
MRQYLIAAVATVAMAGFGLSQARADKVELKDTHLCCGNCVKAVGETLKKVDGVSDANCDQKARTVTFTAKDEKVAGAALKALADAGFYGSATKDGKEFKVEVAEVKKGTKADTVTVTDVHVCCGMCKQGVAKALKDLKISYDGDGAQKSVKVEGKDLDKADIIDALRKAGFNGKVSDK